MKLQNISKKLLTGVVFTAALVSCSEDKMDEINKIIIIPQQFPQR